MSQAAPRTERTAPEVTRVTWAADRDQGGVTLLVVTLMGVLLSLTLVLATLASALVAQRRTAASADLAALAGAVALAGGRAPCPAADSLVRRNGGRLTACRPAGSVLSVRVDRRLRLGLLGTWTLHADARAGPEDGSAAAGARVGAAGSRRGRPARATGAAGAAGAAGVSRGRAA